MAKSTNRSVDKLERRARAAHRAMRQAEDNDQWDPRMGWQWDDSGIIDDDTIEELDRDEQFDER